VTSNTLFSLVNIHTTSSLVGIISGLIVAFGMLASKRLPGWTELFLASTVLTSATGFLFPIHGFTPGLLFGIISIVVLAIAIPARYMKRLSGPWRWIYVITAMIALYLNCFVLVVQLFQKVSALNVLDPTQTGSPFKIAQAANLGLFLLLTIFAVRKFQPDPIQRG
jgi:hypothetical protein